MIDIQDVTELRESYLELADGGGVLLRDASSPSFTRTPRPRLRRFKQLLLSAGPSEA